MDEPARFARCLAVVLRFEGGFVDNPKDPGGTTNLGVTLGTAKAYHLDVDHDGDVDAADVHALTPELVAPVYRTGYWLAAGCDRLAPGLDLMIFDCAVNQGPGRARQIAAQALATPDPIRTASALRKAHYLTLPTFAVFGHGWLNRLTAITTTARQWAQNPEGAAHA